MQYAIQIPRMLKVHEEKMADVTIRERRTSARETSPGPDKDRRPSHKEGRSRSPAGPEKERRQSHREGRSHSPAARRQSHREGSPVVAPVAVKVEDYSVDREKVSNCKCACGWLAMWVVCII